MVYTIMQSSPATSHAGHEPSPGEDFGSVGKGKWTWRSIICGSPTPRQSETQLRVIHAQGYAARKAMLPPRSPRPVEIIASANASTSSQGADQFAGGGTDPTLTKHAEIINLAVAKIMLGVGDQAREDERVARWMLRMEALVLETVMEAVTTAEAVTAAALKDAA